MNTKILAGIIAAVALVLVGRFTLNTNTPALGSISDGGAYQSTTTDLMVGGGVSRTTHLLKPGFGHLGSVVITTSAQGALTLYDGTTTNHVGSGTTTLMKIGSAATVGTYQCDCSFVTGLVLYNDSGAIASSTITWK